MLVIYIKQVRTPVRVVPFILALKENGNVTRTARRPVQLRLPRLSGPLDARRAMLRVYLHATPQGRGNGGQATGRPGEVFRWHEIIHHVPLVVLELEALRQLPLHDSPNVADGRARGGDGR